MQTEEATKDIRRLMQEKEKLIDISNMLRADMVQMTEDMRINTKHSMLAYANYIRFYANSLSVFHRKRR